MTLTAAVVLSAVLWLAFEGFKTRSRQLRRRARVRGPVRHTNRGTEIRVRGRNVLIEKSSKPKPRKR